jgi:hypothetical protein
MKIPPLISVHDLYISNVILQFNGCIRMMMKWLMIIHGFPLLALGIEYNGHGIYPILPSELALKPVFCYFQYQYSYFWYPTRRLPLYRITALLLSPLCSSSPLPSQLFPPSFLRVESVDVLIVYSHFNFSIRCHSLRVSTLIERKSP